MSQSLAAVYVHAIFSTKGRHPFLSDEVLRTDLHSYVGGISRHQRWAPMAVGGTEDHVHILARLGRTIALSDWIKELKRASSLWVKQGRVELSDFAWQGGYGAFSVEAGRCPGVRNYIQPQLEHHKTLSFADEFRRLLAENGMEWDERYLLD